MNKIDNNYLKKINEKNNNILFGKWKNNLDKYNKIFTENIPYEHVIIPNFLEESYANKLHKSFPDDNFDSWYKYKNPLEVKLANDKIEEFPEILKNFFYILSTDYVVNKFSKISGIENLEIDPYLHGAGIHAHSRGGKLNIHLDYERHPYSGKQRRLNLILYLSKDWKDKWGGATELWDENVTKCVSKSKVIFNYALLFKTNDISWHGLPEEIKCPEGIYRKTIAYYYVSDLEYNKKIYRNKAQYTTRPCDKYDERIKELCRIRSERRLTEEDLKE